MISRSGSLVWVGLLVAAALVAACTPQPEPGQSAELLVLGGTVVTMDEQRTIIEDGGIAVAGGRIVDIGAAAEIRQRWQAERVIEANEHDLVIPGLINGHNHAAMTLLRGLADDLKLMDWLQDYIFPAEAQAVDERFVRVGTQLATLEMIRTGTTTFTDMYYFEDVVAEVVDEAGMRGVLGQSVIGFPAPDLATPEAALDYAATFIERWKDHPRITATVAPHAPYTVSPEILRRSAQTARDHGVPILIHLAESADEVTQIAERYGLTPTAHLDEVGFLGPDVIAFHAIWLDDADIATLAARGVGLVHNPESNMKLAAGRMRVGDLQAAGIAVGLGTDGAASNNDLDMFSAMLVAPLLQKHALGDPTALPATEVVAMATINGARALHMEADIGSLEIGKRGDIVVLDGDAANLVPRYDPYSHLAYATHGKDVRATIVEGRLLFLDGDYLTLDAASIRAAARELAGAVQAAVSASR